MQCSLREYTWKIYPESKLIAEAVLPGLPLHPSESDYLGTVPRNARRPGILAYFPCFSIGRSSSPETTPGLVPQCNCLQVGVAIFVISQCFRN